MIILLQGVFWLVTIIGIVILIHEFGHFIAAKILGVRVEEFAFGFGRSIVSKKVGDTLYRINLIPYGGYVKLLGEGEESKAKGSFSAKPIWVRSIIVSAGIFMNFVLAVCVFYLVIITNDFKITLPNHSDYKFIGAEVEIHDKPYVKSIVENSPADEAGLPDNSIIWAIDDIDIKSINDFQTYLEDHKGEKIKIELIVYGEDWWESGEMQEISVRLREEDEEGVLLGVEYAPQVASIYNIDYSNNKIFSGLAHSVNFAGYNGAVLKDLIVYSFKEREVETISKSVGGVVSLANVTYELVKVGSVIDILNLLAITNLLLGIMNLLPIPALDGGYLLFFLIEKVRGKKLSEKYQEWAIKIGFIVLIALGIAITVKDVIQFNVFGRVFTFFKNLF
jgi:regulator of sigma E protease